MAFPTTSVIDDFNRADSGTLGSNWSRGDGGTDIGSIGDEECALGETFGEMYWNAQQFGPDCEAFVNVTDPSPTNVDGHGVAARLTGVGTANWSGYVVYVFLSSNAFFDTWEIYRVDNGVYTRI